MLGPGMTRAALRLNAIIFAVVVIAGGCGDRAKDGASSAPARPGGVLTPAAVSALSNAERLARADDRLRKHLAPSSEGFAHHTDGVVSAGWRKPRLGAFHGVGSRADLASARSPWDVALGKSERYRVRFVPIGAESVPGAESGGRVVYAGAYPDADLLLAASATRAEALVLLRSPRAPDHYRFRVELGAGFSELRKSPLGEVEVLDAGKSPRLIIERPYALDATGKRRDAELSLAERELYVRLDTAGLSFPVLLDPVIKPAIWRKLKSPGLTQRTSSALGFDPERNETILFGGEDGYGQAPSFLSDTWAWNGTSWALRTTQGPSPRVDSALAWDPGRKVLVLFGGRLPTGNWSPETWEWNGSIWTLRQSSTTPPALSKPVAVTFRSKVLLVGFSGSSAQTWEWDGTNWVNKAPATVPTSAGNSSRALVVDPVRDAAVLLTQMGIWQWDGSNWTAASPATRPSTAYDYAGGYVGGKAVFLAATTNTTTTETWTWDGATFTKLSPVLSPPGVQSASAALDATRNRLVLTGGITGSDYVSTTWEWDGSAWSKRAPDQAPCARRSAALAYDPVRQRLLVFGGHRFSSTAANADELWSYDGASWKLEAKQPSLGCNEPSVVWSTTLGALVVHNCDNGVTNFWNGSAWSGVSAGGPAVNSYSPRMAEDAARGVIVAVTADNPRQTWEFNGTAWSQITTATSIDTPSLRQGLGVVKDGTRTLLFDGAGRTWAYDANNWLLLSPGTSPPSASGYYPQLMLDTARRRPLLIPALAADRGTVWEWDSQNWLPLPADGSAPPAQYGVAAYDVRRGKVVFFGDDNDSSLYELELRGGVCDENSDCDTGHCVDGVCCETATCPTCQACNVAQQAGVCAPAIDLSDPVDCPAPNTCGPTGTCGKPKGAACAANDECGLRFCSDGVCCDRDCSAGCNRCDLPGKAGTCTPVASGDPGTPSCAPYVCKGQDTCPSTCSANTDCAGGAAGAGKCTSGSCVSLKAPGATCSAGTECGTGFCADGVCCNVACTGLCQGCRAVRTGLAEGTCGPIPDGTACGSASCTNGLTQGQICVGGNCSSSSRPCAPFLCAGSTCGTSCAADTDCVAGSRCVGGTCTGGTDDGRACLRGSDCKSGYCVDRVCCATSCDGECQACSSDRKADGSPSGTCAKALAGMPCGVTACAPVTDVINGQLCNAQGTCVSSSLLCTPYHCDAQSIGCRTTCTSNADCQAGFECSGERCRGILPNGATCRHNDQCSGNHCVDGVCCESACDGACESCALPDNLGLCKPVASGDPGTPSCAPYKCNGTSGACATSCATDTDCTGSPCVGNACKTKALAESCSADAECESKHCVDGVCCESDCKGCRACSAAAKGDPDSVDGKCELVVAGRDPHNACAEDEASSCRQDGSCDGQGGCRLWRPGTRCGEGTRCEGDFVVGKTCDGLGSCATTPETRYSCANRGAKCIDGACANPCVSFPEPCKPGTQCDVVSGECIPSYGQGRACDADYQCLTGHCVDRVCCNDPCTDSCKACNLGGDLTGVCSAVPAGEPPRGERVACNSDPDHPICAGSCDGAGACKYPTVQCDSQCKNGTVTFSNCNQGSCARVNADPIVCSPYACSSAGDKCLSVCTSDADCAQGFECKTADGGASECVPKPNGRCRDDATLIDTTTGREITCIAYKCQADRCKETCANATDCQTGFVCDGARHCVLPPEALNPKGPGAAPAADDGCGCRVAGQPDRRGVAWLALLGVGLALRRRRLRSK